MKTFTRIILLLVIASALIFTGTALASGATAPAGDEFVTGNYTLSDGETLNGSLWIMGGTARLEEGSRVTGNIMLAGGTLSVDGEVDGNIVATGGNISLEDDAIIHGDVSTVGAHLERDSEARINGDVRTDPTSPFQEARPGASTAPAFQINFQPLWDITSYLFRAFFTAALAVAAVMFWPRQVRQVADTALSQPVISGGLGLLTIPAAVAMAVVLTITIILIPVSLVLVLALAIAALFGWLAIGLEIGQRVAVLAKQDWAPPVAAGVGTLLLSLLVGGFGEFIDCVGFILPFLVGAIGLGAVLLTRFGTQAYTSYNRSSAQGPVAPVVLPAGTPAGGESREPNDPESRDLEEPFSGAQAGADEPETPPETF